MTAYYNEIDPKAAAWLRELIKHGHIAPGDVDERSIEDVTPRELAGYTQCHFFAGIGGWSYALRLAGWPDDEPVWTGSCPCQPFSAAGQGGGFADERHLWPAFFHLIDECRPSVIFGEQVASKDGLTWLDLVSSDMEAACYAFGAADLCAASVGAPHIRQRLYFVGESDSHRSAQRHSATEADGYRRPAESASRLGDGNSSRRANNQGRQGSAWKDGGCISPSNIADYWGNAAWLECADGKHRAIEPGVLPLAYGLPSVVGELRGYGNAIVPQVAQEFIGAYLDCTSLRHRDTL